MKKTIFIILFLSMALFAGLIDGIAVIVNGEPITMIEILKVSKTLNISKSKALDLLIEEKLQEAEIKREGIVIDEFELEKEIEKFAKKRGLTLYEFKDFLAQKGIYWQDYKKEFEKNLLKKRFFQKITATNLSRPTEKEIKRYYNDHLEEFSFPKYVEVIKYLSKNRASLQKIIKNPMASTENVLVDEERVDISSINPKIALLLKDTKEHSFTPILNLGGNYLLMYIKRKIENTPLPYEQIKNSVISKMIEEKREKIIKEYLAKLKASAKIKVLRLP